MNEVHATIKHLFITSPNVGQFFSPANRMIKFEIKRLLGKPLYLASNKNYRLSL